MANEVTVVQEVSKVKFCWECGRKLWNPRRFVKKLVDGHERVLHKQCAEELAKDPRRELENERF